MFKRVALQPTLAQRQFIAQELGREPEGMQLITALDSHGNPLAVQVSALVRNQPFPTLYWLTNKNLIKELSHLEAAGLIKQLEDLLLEDAALMAAYRRSHTDYIDQRWQAMDPATKAAVARLGYTQVFAERGVGGIQNWQQVRCLHTQYAHHLSSGNAIGQWLDEKCSISSLIK